MPRAAKTPAPTTETTLAFEDALEQLEELVREMESEQIPLEALIRKYEEGARLYRTCEQRLDEARGRIEILRKKRSGETVLEPFGDGPVADAPGEEGSDAPQENGELF